ncbi:MAG: hypothetical protein HY475_00780, partial [Candidatus Terrybacteria bacterium]|nr:hypothetical protein [Candidatus Terrybacteria bacterium]
MRLATQKLARILRTHETTLEAFERAMEHATGKAGVYDAIVEENDLLVRAVLEHLNFTIETKAEHIHEALMEKIRENDTRLSEYLHRPACTTREGCETV